MSTFSVPIGSVGVKPSSIFSSFNHRSKTLNPSFRRSHLGFLPNHGLCRRGGVGVAKFGLGQTPFFDPDGPEGMMVKDLFGRVEMFLYTVADAAVAGSQDAVLDDSITTAKQSDWLSGITNGMETVLKVLKGGLSTLHVPYSYGFAIILLTVLVKAATYPLTKKQVESAMSMRTLAPQIKAIQERYAGDQEKIQLETARLYKLAGINPLAGCLPTLATIPIWIGLYRALSNVADEGLLTEGFFWIPSLAGPTTIAAKQTGSGISWLFQFVDGHPPLGWNDTLAYLVLPVLLVVSQYISVQIMQQQQPQSNDPNMKTSQTITKFLPLLIGYFALSVPSGLSLYWLTNNILSTAQQVYLQKLGGAKSLAKQLNDEIVKKELRKMPEIPKSISEATANTKIDRVEKPASQGPQPGERFKQLKEEEARKRRQREEEKRKAEEAKAQLEGSEPSNTINQVEKSTNGADEHHSANGAISLGAENHVKTADLNGSPGDDRVDQPQLEESTEKDEVAVNVDNKSPGKDENQE